METLLDYSDVLIRPRYSRVNSRKDVVLERTFTFQGSKQVKTVIPIVASNMATVGTPKAAEVLKSYNMLTALHKFVDIKGLDLSNSIVTVGQNDNEIATAYKTLGMHYDGYLMVDVANGHTDLFLKYCEAVRKLFPKAVLIAGNTASRKIVSDLRKIGVDIVKVGIGPGQHCLTRTVTGVGVPQLSAVMEAAEAAAGCGIYVMADGGITEYGDVAKAFVAGADFVMIGSMFAGHSENSGKVTWDTKSNGYVTECYGMASEKAMITHYGKVEPYRTSEGRHTLIPYKGKLYHTIDALLGGLRSACTYTDSEDIESLAFAELCKVNRTLNRSLEKYEI